MCKNACRGDAPVSVPEFGVLPLEGAREKFFCVNIIGQVEGHALLDAGQKPRSTITSSPCLCRLRRTRPLRGSSCYSTPSAAT